MVVCGSVVFHKLDKLADSLIQNTFWKYFLNKIHRNGLKNMGQKSIFTLFPVLWYNCKKRKI